MDHVYVWNGTAGPTESPERFVEQPCGVDGELHFVKDGFKYAALDKDGNEVAECQDDQSLTRQCSQYIGASKFETQYRCTSSSITYT